MLPPIPSDRYISSPLSSAAVANRIKPSIDDIEELHKSGSEVSDDENFAIDDETTEDEDEDREDNENGDREIEKNSNVDPFWKKTLRQEERLNERYQLKKLHERSNFLPNPRLFAARTAPL